MRIAASLPGTAGRRRPGTTRYYLTDQVDSVKVVANDMGAPVKVFEYLPYGESFVEAGEEKHSPKYNSQELDKESSFYFYNARHYDPEIARFVTADTVVDGSDAYGAWNRYMYVHGNPIAYKDPSGHDTLVAFEGWNTSLREGDNPGEKIPNTEANKDRLPVKLKNEAMDFAQENKIKDFKAEAYGPDITDAVIDKVVKFIDDNTTRDKSGKQTEKIILYGFSLGGDTALEVAEKLKERNLTVDLLVTVDPATGPGRHFGSQNEVVPSNVKKAFNLYTESPHSGPIMRSDSKESEYTKSESFNFSKSGPLQKESQKTWLQNTKIPKDANVSHGNMAKYTYSFARAAILSELEKTAQQELNKK